MSAIPYPAPSSIDSPSATGTSAPAAAAAVDPITTHVLDQTSGRPAEGLRARLELVSSLGTAANPTPRFERKSTRFFADTAPGSGRIARWHHLPNNPSESFNIPVGELEQHSDGLRLERVLNELRAREHLQTIWSLHLETGLYWQQRGIQTFYPFVELNFKVDYSEEEGHWHVPFLLGPFGFTTYRGT